MQNDNLSDDSSDSDNSDSDDEEGDYLYNFISISLLN